MATIQTIATTLTADARPAVASLRTFDAEVGKAFSRLDSLNKRAMPSLGGPGQLAAVGRGGSEAARGLLEASRAAEDFAVGFGVNGIQGAIRGSLNNLSQMSFLLGGPLVGAVAGFAAAGVSALSPYIAKLVEASDATRALSRETDIFIEKNRKLGELRTKEAEHAIDFRIELKGGDAESTFEEIRKRRAELQKIEARQRELEQAQNPNDNRAESERIALLQREAELRREIGRLQEQVPAEADALGGSIEKRRTELEKLEARIKEIDAERARNRGRETPQMSPLEQRAFAEKSPEEQKALLDQFQRADERAKELQAEKLELLRKETELRVEIGQLKRREMELTKEETELQRKKDQDEFAAIIRKFQIEDERQAEQEHRDADRKRKEQNRDELRDNDRLQNILRDRMRGLGGNLDPLEGLAIPDRAGDLKKERAGLVDREGKLIDEFNELRNRVFAEPGDNARWLEIEKELSQIKERRGQIRGELESLGDKTPLADRLRGVLGEIDDLNKRPKFQLAQVATADSQALLRAQAFAKDSAERKRAEAALLAKLDKLIEEVKKARPPEIEGDDVNLT